MIQVGISDAGGGRHQGRRTPHGGKKKKKKLRSNRLAAAATRSTFQGAHAQAFHINAKRDHRISGAQSSSKPNHLWPSAALAGHCATRPQGIVVPCREVWRPALDELTLLTAFPARAERQWENVRSAALVLGQIQQVPVLRRGR